MAEDAVMIELLSAKFPANREKYREFAEDCMFRTHLPGLITSQKIVIGDVAKRHASCRTAREPLGSTYALQSHISIHFAEVWAMRGAPRRYIRLDVRRPDLKQQASR